VVARSSRAWNTGRDASVPEAPGPTKRSTRWQPRAAQQVSAARSWSGIERSP
jgi:hypothetical protein